MGHDHHMPLKWGILSTANINQAILQGASASGDAEVVAVASRDGERARRYADAHGIPCAHGSYEALLADPEVEAVYNPLPNALHHPWTLTALRAGKHVLCEKPYTRRPAEVAEAFDLAGREGLVLSEAFMYRYHPQTVRLAELVAGGAIGELRMMHAAFSWRCDDPTDIRLDPDLDGGALMDVGAYCVSAARLLAGEPVSVTAQQQTSERDVDLQLAGTLAFEGGALCHFDASFAVSARSVLELAGSEGTIRVGDPWHIWNPGLTLHPHGGEPQEIAIAPADSYRLELEQMAAAVRGEPTTLLGRADAEGQARAIAALYEAAASGRSVAVQGSSGS
jgi:xylose dehydrogenase (NAD/NADP)